MNTYIRSLADPFDATIAQPKILDGRVDRTAGLRFRITGDFTCKTSAPSYVVLFPGFQNVIAWRGLDVEEVPIEFPNHIPDGTAAGGLDGIRIVSAALKLSLLNSSHENEGYWEAARFPLKEIFASAATTITTPAGSLTKNRLNPTTGTIEALAGTLASNPTFQTGKLRDLHRFQFKVNSMDTDHEFVNTEASSFTVSNMLDRRFDMVVIKIHGRVDATSPSVLHYDCVCNQEVVYNEATVAARIMGRSPAIPNMDHVLQKANYKYAAIRIA